MSKQNQNEHIPYVPFETYKEQFAEAFTMKREDGIIEVCMHRENDSAMWGVLTHKGWGQVFKMVGQDPENEILIISGTGDNWLLGMAPEAKEKMADQILNDPAEFRRSSYYGWYSDGLPLLYNLVHDVHIPTIGILNGPGMHAEFPLVCDLTLAAPDAEVHEPHFAFSGTVAGDGLYLVLQELLGVKRANELALTGKHLSAQEAKELGAINEVLPREELLPRAWELAREIKKQDYFVRRLQREVMRRRWRRLFEYDLSFDFALECWAECIKDRSEKSEVESMLTGGEVKVEGKNGAKESELADVDLNDMNKFFYPEEG